MCDKSDYPLDRDETNTRRGLRGVLLTPKVLALLSYLWCGSLPVRLFLLRGYTAMKFKVFIAVIVLTALSIPPTQAADTGWRYWGYFQAAPGATTWTAAMTGPTVDIKDGAVEGWSFVFSNDDIPSVAPSVKPNFTTICGNTKAVPGKKRIGLVVDF